MKRKQILFSEAMNFCKKFTVRILNWYLAGRKLKLSRHFLTRSGEPVCNIFINRRVAEKSNDRILRESNEGRCPNYVLQASSNAYNLDIVRKKNKLANY